jgi:GDP-L-fucose synthase
MAPQPLREEYLLTGPLEPTNEPYAIAKIAGIELCEAFNRQYGTHFLSVMPTNLYGPEDNYDLENSHVLPALIRKFHLAKMAASGDWKAIEIDERIFGPIPSDFRSCLTEIAEYYGYTPPNDGWKRSAAEVAVVEPAVILWGTGLPRREFLYSDDLADACVFLMERIHGFFPDASSSQKAPAPRETAGPVEHLFNIGAGEDLAISELADLVSKIVGYRGQIGWNKTAPDGAPRKLMEISKMRNLGWKAKVKMEEGIRLAYQDYTKKLFI